MAYQLFFFLFLAILIEETESFALRVSQFLDFANYQSVAFKTYAYVLCIFYKLLVGAET